MPGWFKTHDGLEIRYGIWKPETGKARGSVVILAGRGEFLEKYHETVTDLLARNMMVFSLDWRGQGLSSRMTARADLGHVDSFDDYLRDLDLFVREIVRPRMVEPSVMLAHSMGAHLGLRYLAERPGFFQKAVLTSPMIQIHTAGPPAVMISTLVQIAVGLGFGKARIPFTSDRNQYRGNFEDNLLTGSQDRFERNRGLLVSNAGLLTDSVSFGWLKAAFDSMAIVNRPEFAGRIQLPVLIVAAGNDKIVSSRAARKLASWLPNSTFHLLEGARHEILQERNELRERFWLLFHDFIGPAG